MTTLDFINSKILTNTNKYLILIHFTQETQQYHNNKIKQSHITHLMSSKIKTPNHSFEFYHLVFYEMERCDFSKYQIDKFYLSLETKTKES